MPVSGGETAKDPSGWTIDTVLAHLERRIEDLVLRLEQRFQAQEAALSEKDATTQARLANVNEFRGQLSDVLDELRTVLATMLPRSEADQRFRALETSIDQRVNQVNAKASELSARHTADLSNVNSRLDLMSGGTAGLDKSRQIIGWGIAVLVGLASLAFILIERAP